MGPAIIGKALPSCPDNRVENAFQAASGLRIAENDLSQRSAVERGVGQRELQADRRDHFMIGSEQFMHTRVRVESREVRQIM